MVAKTNRSDRPGNNAPKRGKPNANCLRNKTRTLVVPARHYFTLGEVPVTLPNRVKISIVSPVYHASGCLRELYQRLVQVLESVGEDFEIVLVNDGSPDDSWDIILELAAGDSRVKGVNLSRNFGQHCAITAGLDHAAGDWIVVMDCDL